jgi:hypothetical protein
MPNNLLALWNSVKLGLRCLDYQVLLLVLERGLVTAALIYKKP